MGITEILRRIWIFSENKITNSESICKQPTQLIVELNSSLQQKIDTFTEGRGAGILRILVGTSQTCHPD